MDKIDFQTSEQEAFELVYETLMPMAEVSEGKFLDICRQQFYHEAWYFNRQLTLICGQSSVLNGWYRAKVYRPKEDMPLQQVRAFIKNSGSFPGAFGAASFWMFEAIKELAPASTLEKFVESFEDVTVGREISIHTENSEVVFLPQGLRIFALEEKEMPLHPCLIRFEGKRPNWYFDLAKAASPDGMVSKSEAFLLLVKIPDVKAPSLAEIKLQ